LTTFVERVLVPESAVQAVVAIGSVATGRARPDSDMDIIESMVGGPGKQFVINTANDGVMPKIADDAFLELLCDVKVDGSRPLPVGDMPRALYGWQRLVLDAHELTAKAVATYNYGLLCRAMLVDPLISSIGDADAILQELLAAERA
jgi:alpha-galactosidase